MKKHLYVEIYEHFKTMIRENTYKADDRLPSKRKLANSWKISPLTVEAAYQQLIAEGYVYSLEKKGYFVAKQIERLNLAQTVTVDKKKEIIDQPSYAHVFRTNVVDTSLFPNATWAKLARQVLAEHPHEMLNVMDAQGMLELRIEIQKYLETYRGIQVDPDQIIIGSGSSPMIGILVEMLGRNRHYGVENPGYSKIYQLFKANDVHLSVIPLDAQGLDISVLKKTNTDVIHITPSHQFPTGIVMPIQRRIELLNWVQGSKERWIIEDDYDSEFRYQGKPIPALFGLDNNDKVIYMNSFTKTLAPSFRMNYMVLPRQLMSRYQPMKDYHGCTVPNFEQYIMMTFMRGGYFERHIHRMRKSYKQKIDLMTKHLHEIDDFEIIGEEAGLHFMLKIHRNIDETSLVEHLKNHGIYITALSDYDHESKMQKPDHPTLIIGYSGIPMASISQATKNLIQTILSYDATDT